MLKERAISIFDWKFKGVEIAPFLQSEYIETLLLKHRYVVFYKNEKYGFLCEPANCIENNILKLPAKFETIYTKSKLYFDDCVYISNQFDTNSLMYAIKIYANKLASIETSADQLIKLAKYPFIIKANEYTKLEAKKIFNNIENYEMAIFSDNQELLDNDFLSVLNTGVNLNDLDLLEKKKQKTLEEFNTILGISSLTTKKERLISNEVESINELTNIVVSAKLDRREKVANEIFKKFGIETTIEFRANNKHYTENDFRILGQGNVNV